MTKNKLTAANSSFLKNVKEAMNAPIYRQVSAMVNEAGDIHAADAFLGGYFNDVARAARMAEFHAPKQLQATDLNLFALRCYLQGGHNAQPSATDRDFPNAIAQVDAPHLRRCIKAGLLAPTGTRLQLTEKGCAALGLRAAKEAV